MVMPATTTNRTGFAEPHAPRTGQRRRYLRVVLCFILAALPATGFALDSLPGAQNPRVVPDTILAEQRGGFFGRDGLQIAIGLDQITSLNGETLHQTTLLPIGSLNQAASHARTASRIMIRSGPDAFPPRALVTDSLDGTGWVTTIQNQLDGQAIHHQTIMQLELRNLQMPRSDLGRALDQQLLDGGRGW